MRSSKNSQKIDKESLEGIVNTFKEKGFRVFFDLKQVEAKKRRSEKGECKPIILTIDRSKPSMKPFLAYQQALYQLQLQGIAVSPNPPSREYGLPVFEQGSSIIQSYQWMAEFAQLHSPNKVCGNVFFKVRYVTNASGRAFSFAQSEAFNTKRYLEL